MKAASKNCFEVINSRFKTFNGNRELIADHINAIYRAIKQGEILPPIIVDSDSKLIIDGQHRYEAFKRVWKEGINIPMNVFYGNYKNPTIAAITHNNTAIRWNISTFIKAFAAIDIPEVKSEYTKLTNFAKTHPLFIGKHGPVYASICCLLGSKSGQVREGKFHMPEDMDTVETIYKECLEIEAVMPGVIRNRPALIGWMKARHTISETVAFSEFIQKFDDYFVNPTSSRSDDWCMAFVASANHE